VLLDEALNTIVEEILQCLECDRASCFIVDHAKNELWSKVAKGTSTIIRFPMNKGIAGHVATTKELLNIQNAYLDQRFNQDVDVQTNYKTKSLLVCPILDGERCLGVLQCVNKLEGHFTKDDEALLMILAEFSRVVLNNAMNHDE
jgi:GAF domain-containing protein